MFSKSRLSVGGLYPSSALHNAEDEYLWGSKYTSDPYVGPKAYECD